MTGVPLTTGLPGLDRMLKGLMPGDNIVWQVDSIDDYAAFVTPYSRRAQELGKRLVYFRFAGHPPLIPDEGGAEIHLLRPEAGFETFITEIHRVIEASGHGGFYVFDCLSELAELWYSDQMLANFFLLTCPYLYDVEAIAYFAVFKNYHSFHATMPIADTAQVLLDVYRHKGRLYVHPLKVQQRYSPTMYMLHVWQGEEFTPATESATIAEILTSIPWAGMRVARAQLGVWNRALLQGEEVRDPTERRECSIERADEVTRRLLRMVVSRDERVLELVHRYLTLSDVLEIGKRMIGTGLIGGKSVGMLLARAILKRADPRWEELLEPHDSFYIGSDVFYTFLVRNGVWWVRQQQRDPQTFLKGAERGRQRILMGTFPEYTLRQFEDMLDYYGQSPIIVRSSSLLEDNFGNSFAGKYESVFCANQGPRQKRLDDFLSAVRTIYASTMSEKALRYRAHRGLLDRDEQMSLLVQRVSGAMYGHRFFPQVAGVGFSFNAYVWNENIDPNAGVLRLVFGLGTRAVDRSDDDYTRVVALNAPQLRPESGTDAVRQYAQRRVDVIDLQANQLVSEDFAEVASQSPGLPLEMFASPDEAAERLMAETGRRDIFPWMLTFDRLLSETSFVADMREMLAILEDAYGCPVDTEFTANFFGDEGYRINLVQCRPLPVNAPGMAAAVPADLRKDDLILEARGAVIGQSRTAPVDRLIYVVPSVYGRLPVNERYAVARLIGQITHADEPRRPKTIMLLGPGRWGTTTPSLGVPVSFAEINTISVLCEIVAMREDLVPDVSLGTHFFNELVEQDILYLALFPDRAGNLLNEEFLRAAPNKLARLIPDAGARSDVVRVIDVAELADGRMLILNANAVNQRVVCYLDRDGSRRGGE